MLDPKEIDIEIARLEYGESSYPAYQKLANLYTIRNQMNHKEPEPAYEASYSAAPADTFMVEAYGDSEFVQAIAGRRQADVWEVMDDLMDTLHVANPRVYNGVMRKLRSI